MWLAAAALLAASDGQAPGRLGLTAELDVPAATVLRIFSDVGRYPSIFPAIKRADVRSRSPGRSVSFIEVEFPWPIGPRWLLAETTVAGDRIRWRRLEGTLKRFEGSLQASDIAAGRSKAIYDAIVDPGWVAPGWLSGWLEARVIEGVLAETRRYLRDHADDVAQRTSAR